MDKTLMKKSLLDLMQSFTTTDGKCNRDELTEFVSLLKSDEFRTLHRKLPQIDRNIIYAALYPYDECRVEVKCPHCGKTARVDAVTTAMSPADGYWAVVKCDDQLFLDWDNDFEVDVSALEYRCCECDAVIAHSLSDIEDMRKEQQKTTISEELGILGK